MRLLIVTSVLHYRHQGALWAYGPYVREIEIWADLFSEVRLAGPCSAGKPAGDCLPIRRKNVTISPKVEAGGPGVAGKLPYLWKLPLLICQLIADLMWSQAVHVRNPGNIPLLGVLLAPIFSRRLVSKYAGQWIAYPGEPITVRLQRGLLASRWWRGPVTVYGQWPDQPAHVVPFFTSAMFENELARARAASGRKHFDGPLRVLYVGRLSGPKNVDVLIRAVARANQQGAHLDCQVIGAGPELTNLRKLADELKVDVDFTGGLEHAGVLERFERAHILVLASDSEGWPKSLVEGMAHGLLCIGSNRGLVPELLSGNRGFVVPVRDVDAIVSVLSAIAEHPDRYASMSRAAAAWAQRFSLERLRDELRVLLESRWNTRLSGPSDGPAAKCEKQAAVVTSF